MKQFSPLTGQVVTVDRVWRTSHIYLTTSLEYQWYMVHFINTNGIFDVYVDRNNESNMLFTKHDFN